jgi:DNA-binding transcriptional MerR regulator/effector-binding domain-containing protein
MSTMITIGDFSRMTHLSVKTLRHYHDVGLLVPADVDRFNGYRLYEPEQAATAQVIRRLRELDMPVDEVKAVLSAPDVGARNAAVVAHLARMEAELQRTQATVVSLRTLLSEPRPPVEISYRTSDPTTALAISSVVTVADAGPWWAAAFAELHQVVADLGLRRVGVDGSLYAGELFTDATGELTVFVPVADPPTMVDGSRAHRLDLPATEYAIAVHHGAFEDLDTTYSALGAAVAEQSIGVDAPIREDYLVSAADTDDITRHRTAVSWPVFHLTPAR